MGMFTDELERLTKGRGLPIGTIRTHGGIEKIKTAEGWKPRKGARKKARAALRDEPKTGDKPALRSARILQKNRVVRLQKKIDHMPRAQRKELMDQYRLVQGKGTRATEAEVSKLRSLLDTAEQSFQSEKAIGADVTAPGSVTDMVGSVSKPPYSAHHQGGKSWVTVESGNLAKVRSALSGMKGAESTGTDRWNIGGTDVRIYHEGSHITVQANAPKLYSRKQKQREALRMLGRHPGVS